MPNSHLKFHSTNGKRLILVADDELINREILGTILKADYEVIFANDGAEALRMMREHRDTLSLVLLDLLMPVKSGTEVLKSVREDASLAAIPIIVLTSEQEAEIESLKLGAADFIPKPYPAAGVILARVERTIQFHEDRETLESTERDLLTGLYNKEFFFRYAEQFDQFHKDTATDAVMVDVNHFRMLNERYGKGYGDQVLRRIGEKLREIVQESGGIVSRREADTFMVYCPHRTDYKEILENASVGLAGEELANNRVRLRMGIYSDVDKGIDIERRFDRAKMAADTVKGSFTNTIGFYDEALHEKQILNEQLIEDFPAAVGEKQFLVYYQPKFDVTREPPVLASAEALVRWNHPKLGMVSPGAFIPLFEENGLIQRLDEFVWREAAAQIRHWKELYGFSIPVSVNVSRIDLYDPNLIGTLKAILSENALAPADLVLEITESAYTEDSQQIIDVAQQLRALGFHIEMDDFGTGYSSLNMISSLPIDALKLDMKFVHMAFREGGSTHMMEVILQIAGYLNVPVIAEGVENEEQMDALKSLGCEYIQGYFFSKPVPPKDFEPFIMQRKEVEKIENIKKAARVQAIANQVSASEKEGKQTAGADEPKESDFKKKDFMKGRVQSRSGGGLQLRTANIFFSIMAFLAAVALFVSDISVTNGYRRMEKASDRYIAAQFAASDMESGSDYLTDRVRCFVVTGEISYLEDFFEEVNVTKRRDHAVENLELLLEGKDSTALQSLNTALQLSNDLIDTEYHAMRLVIETGDYDRSRIPDEVLSVSLAPEEKALTKEELRAKSENLVFDNDYMHYKDRIRENVALCTQSLIRSSSQELEAASSKMSLLVHIQTAMTILILLIVTGFVAIIRGQIRRPLSIMVEKMKSEEEIPPTGAEELRFVTETYNAILRENKDAKERLSHEASHDALTGLLNRGAYDLLMKTVDTAHMALIIVDVDYFKQINDTYGHAVGDRVLKRVAEILQQNFRSVDIICRFGGDEFVVVMTRSNSSMRQLVLNKIAHANDLLQHPKDDLPPVSLSVGVAFSDRNNPSGDIFTDADTALYRVKEAGRNGCMIY